MSYSVSLPLGGYAGWLLLNRTAERQKTALTSTAAFQRTQDYFRQNISQITSAEELVADRRLLTVALGAFGLSADINSKFFVKKVLESDTQDPKALANRLADKSYLRMAEAFGLGSGQSPKTTGADFAETILSAYRDREFEIAVGAANEALRIALTAQRDLPELAARSGTQNSKWYSVIASKPLSSFLQGALGLPSQTGALDVDQQLDVYKRKSASLFGTADLSKLTEAPTMDRLIRAYLVRSQIDSGPVTSGGSAALQLLQSGRQSGRGLSLLL